MRVRTGSPLEHPSTSSISCSTTCCRSYFVESPEGRVTFIFGMFKLMMESKPPGKVPRLNPISRPSAEVRRIWVPPITGSVALFGSLLTALLS